MAGIGPMITPITFTASVVDAPRIIAALAQAVADTQAEGVRLMATYPPQQAGSRYKRTGTLKRSWSAEPVTISGDSISGVIGSNGGIAPYNIAVEGYDQDPFFAARNWPNVRNLMALVQQQLPVRAQAAIDRVTGP